MVTDKVSDIYCRYPASHKAITYWFSIIFLSDMLPTCLRHLSPTFTSALPPHYRHHYRHYYHTKKYTDIYTDKTVSTLSVHRPTAKLITFPKLSQKREEGERRKNRFTPYYIKIAPRPYQTYNQGARVQRFCILIKHSNKQQTFSKVK